MVVQVSTLGTFSVATNDLTYSTVVIDTGGNIIGVRDAGGANDQGALFEILRHNSRLRSDRYDLLFRWGRPTRVSGMLHIQNWYRTKAATSSVRHRVVRPGISSLSRAQERHRRLSLHAMDQAHNFLRLMRMAIYSASPRSTIRSALLSDTPNPTEAMRRTTARPLRRRKSLLSERRRLDRQCRQFPAPHLVNGASIIQAEAIERVDYIHIELDSHDVILAEGAPSETFIDDHSRGMFHNADSFAALYPDERTPGPARLLRDARRGRARIGGDQRPARGARRVAREVIHAGADACAAGSIGPTPTASAAGRKDLRYPDAPVALYVCIDGVVVGRVLAQQFRADLVMAGIGDGHHAFTCPLPSVALQGRSHNVAVRRLADAIHLPSVPSKPRHATDHPGSLSRTPAPKMLTGYLDVSAIAGGSPAGPSIPETPDRHVTLIVAADDRIVARVLADAFRVDLAEKGIGKGRCSFSLDPEAYLPPLQRTLITVRREGDGAPLPGSPVAIETPTAFADMRESVSRAIVAIRDEADFADRLAFPRRPDGDFARSPCEGREPRSALRTARPAVHDGLARRPRGFGRGRHRWRALVIGRSDAAARNATPARTRSCPTCARSSASATRSASPPPISRGMKAASRPTRSPCPRQAVVRIDRGRPVAARGAVPPRSTLHPRRHRPALRPRSCGTTSPMRGSCSASPTCISSAWPGRRRWKSDRNWRPAADRCATSSNGPHCPRRCRADPFQR